MLKRRLLVNMMKRRRRSLMTEKLKKRRNTVYLPEDLLVEILSRVPDASLARFRSTSKGWNALIKKDGRLARNSLFVMVIYHKVYLVRLNLDGIHNNNIEKVISQFSLTDPLSSSSLTGVVGTRHVFHCDGLLLCTTMDGQLVVWNPCSGETRTIIKPSYDGCFHTYALGKSSCNNEYKILTVNIYIYSYWRLTKYGIYDFISNMWRDVGETRDWYIPLRRLYGTCVDGNTYWLTYTDSPTGTWNAALQCFDYSTERFRRVSLPIDTLYYNVIALSATREEKNLCILTSRERVHDIDVWVATKIKGTGDMSWSKLLTVKRTYSQQFLAFRNGMIFVVDRENKILLHPTKYKNSSNCLHILGGNYKHIKVDLDDHVGSTPFRSNPTLVQIQQGSLGLGTWKS